MNATALDIYGGADPRSVPAYSVADASRYLRVPRPTLHAWFFGQRTAKRGGGKPIFTVDPNAGRLLSFKELVSAHVISGLRMHHHVSMQRVRKAIEYLGGQLRVDEPLVNLVFMTDGIDVFVERFCDGTLNATQGGQMALKPLLDAYLKRVDYDRKGVANRLFPFVRRHEAGAAALSDEPRIVVVDPRVAFGRPILAGTNIRTAAIYDRYLAGESIAELAGDYHRPIGEIEEAIRCESAAA